MSTDIITREPIAGCGSAIMEAHLARVADPLKTLRQIERSCPHPIPHVHYAASVASAVRSAMREFTDGGIETVGDGAYQITVTVAGRRHLVTIQPELMRAAQVTA